MFSLEEMTAIMDRVPPMLGVRCGAAEGCDLAKGSYCISFTSPASCKPCAGSCSRVHSSWGDPDCNTRCPIAMFKEQFFDIMVKAAKVKEAQSRDADATMPTPPCPDVSEVLYPYQLAVGLLAGLLLITLALAAVLCYLLYHKIGFDCKRWLSRSPHVASGGREPAQRIQYRNPPSGQQPNETEAMLRPVADAANQTAADLTSPSGWSSQYPPDPLLVPDGATAASANQDTAVKGPSNQETDDVKVPANHATAVKEPARQANDSADVELATDNAAVLGEVAGQRGFYQPHGVEGGDRQADVASQNGPRRDQNGQQQKGTGPQRNRTGQPIPASDSNVTNGQAFVAISPSGKQTHNQPCQPYATDSRLRYIGQPANNTEDSVNHHYPFAVQSPQHAKSYMYIPDPS